MVTAEGHGLALVQVLSNLSSLHGLVYKIVRIEILKTVLFSCC